MPNPDAPAPSPADIFAVAAGGAVGTLLRAAVGAAVPAGDGLPWATLIVNLSGALLLGVVVAALPGSGRWRRYRLTLGTGVLGAYTTFATFAVELEGLASASAYPTLAGYLSASIAGGIGAAMLGLGLGRRLRTVPRS